VLVVGPTGCGKSTTIASLLDRLNASEQKHIITLEDPIEYQHSWLCSVVTQYEIGRDVASFTDGVRGALRADPDVLFIGELRGFETVAACLQAAETGHLVFAALHTPSETSPAINRIIGLFPSNEQDRARQRMADALRAIVGLRLIPLIDGSGLRAAVEILVMTDASRRMLRDGATHQLRGAIVSSRKEGSCPGGIVLSGRAAPSFARGNAASLLGTTGDGAGREPPTAHSAQRPLDRGGARTCRNSRSLEPYRCASRRIWKDSKRT
jgi:twitching motility protein PilT